MGGMSPLELFSLDDSAADQTNFGPFIARGASANKAAMSLPALPWVPTSAPAW